MSERWCYKASFDVLPEVFTLLAELGIEWRLLDAWPMGRTVLLETGHEVKSGWRPVSKDILERCWTQREEGGPCVITFQRVTVGDPDAFAALLGTVDPPPCKSGESSAMPSRNPATENG